MTDEARLQRWLDSHRDAVGSYPSSDHVDVDTLTRYAAGRLPPGAARMVSEHLRACEDGRCGEFVRQQGGDVEALSSDLGAEPSSDAPAEPSRRRTFQSREIVWSTFESLARELEVPIDELVNDAMSAYAGARGYAVASQPEAAAPARPPARGPAPAPAPPPRAASARVVDDPLEETHDAPSALDRSYSPPRGGFDDDDLARTAARGAFVRPAAGRPPSSDGPESRTTPRMRAPLPAPSRPGGPGRALPAVGAPPPPPARSSGAALAPPTSPPRTTRAPETPRESSSPWAAAGRRLVLEYRGRSYTVDKERFLLGRSKTQADLRLDDANVSRQHAVIEHVGAAFYIVDLGSTNGVEVAGERVARRALADGDRIVITTHEIRCTLR
ncbi:MAG: FHA domain-containing protein [Labilithrix sp.]|nr:FHA domain-containing protein [Labilithrix sp.]